MKRAVLCITLAASLSLSSCDLFKHDIKYEVTGSAPSVSLTYENSSGGTSQTTGTPLPWTYTFSGKPGDFLYVSAQNDGASGSVTATIYENGSVVQTSTSSGAYVIATASGSI